MNRIITVYNDNHLFGVHALDNIMTFTENDFHIGDNVDIRGCHERDLKEAQKTLQDIKSKSQHYCSGNHELETDPETYFHKCGGILFTHGDFATWGKEKAISHRTKKAGRSTLSRLKLRIAYPFRELIKVSVSKELKRRCSDLGYKHSCHTIIMGHRHPGKAIEVYHKNVKIIILPRGKNFLYVQGNNVNIRK